MLEVRDLCFSHGPRRILHDVRLAAGRGEMVALLGANGAGKSTLLSCLARIVPPTAGQVLVDGQDLASLSRREVARLVGYVPQKSEASRMTVFDSVLLGRKPHIAWGTTRHDLELCERMLGRVGLADLALREVERLSGGEAQKAMLARALVQQPRLLLLDEPTSSLDPANQQAMLSLVREAVREDDLCALVVIHDLNLALRWCDRFVFLKDGGVFSDGGRASVTPETIAAIYGVQASVCELEGRTVVIV